jgi:hypothetical protein
MDNRTKLLLDGEITTPDDYITGGSIDGPGTLYPASPATSLICVYVIFNLHSSMLAGSRQETPKLSSRAAES